jgi:tetratricopeptide (TPR) repeat protein
MVAINRRLVGRVLVVLLLLTMAVGSIFYGTIVRRNESANQAFLRNDHSAARQEYVDLLSTFRNWSFLRNLFRSQYELTVFNYAQLLYSTGNYRDAVEVLEEESGRFPFLAGTARYHLWMGNAFFRIAILQEGEELSFESLQTVGEEYKEALRLDRNHWDAKHNYEFVQQIVAQKNSESAQDKETLQLLLGDIRLTSEQRRGELPEKLH